jgi:hypothetical protein
MNTAENLIKQIKDGKQFDYLHFWRVDEIPYGAFSQWYPSAFNDGEQEYTNAEQYMMAKKAEAFRDENIKKRIMKATDPREMKELGRAIVNFDDAVWGKLRYAVVKTGNFYKFSQNEKLGKLLLGTDNKVLVEASPRDAVWGIGLEQSDDNASNPKMWQGTNLLGFALMEVRDELKKEKEQ